MARITIIAAVAENGVIGVDNDLPWRCPTDFAFFKRTTMGKPLVMGRKTFQSLGKALPGRTNIVVTRDPAFSAPDIVVEPSLEAALTAAGEADEVMIGGGGEIYRQAMPLADRLLITRIHVAPEGDTIFPAIPPEDWDLVEERHVEPGPKDSHAMTFQTWDRRSGERRT